MPATTHAQYPSVRLPSLLGRDPVVREQVIGLLISLATYLLYGGISLVQVGSGLLHPQVALWLAVVALGANALFYGLVRSGRWARARDPGFGRTQLLFGVALMYPSYAAVGPAAGGLMVVMASHVVYSMFIMTPRQVFRMVGGTLLLLVLTMALCHQLWPDRFEARVQVSNALYALLVMPLIALLAFRITDMTTRLKRQHAELQTALGRLQELATRDELTRTHNRRRMNELLQEQQALHRRTQAPLALALLDIDLFKSINDRLGHAAGDQVLRAFAEVTQQCLRTHDQLARWGGEEFLVLMPHTRREDAVVAMNRLQQRLGEVAAETMPQGLRVSFSAGVTELAPDEPPDRAIERADQAMYRAKTSGRSRCVAG